MAIGWNSDEASVSTFLFKRHALENYFLKETLAFQLTCLSVLRRLLFVWYLRI